MIVGMRNHAKKIWQRKVWELPKSDRSRVKVVAAAVAATCTLAFPKV